MSPFVVRRSGYPGFSSSQLLRRTFLLLPVLIVFAGCAPVFKAAIRGYQKTLGPAKGYRCQFEPSCSQFAYESIDRNGAIEGLLLWGDRSIRCHPFAYTHDKYKWVEVQERYFMEDPVQANELFGRARQPNGRSPWIAGILSSIIPGAGYVYAGRASDGYSAFIKTGLWYGLSSVAKHNHADNLAYGLAGISGFYYLSGIYGSANAATREPVEPPRAEITFLSFEW